MRGRSRTDAASRWYAIEGVIGAGKTATATVVGETHGFTTVLEDIERHPFLEEYYREPARYALETELAFMALHLHQIKRLVNPGTIVSDFSPAKDLIFGELTLGPLAIATLGRTDEGIWDGMARPDISVFLDVPPAVCLERAQRRGRVMEHGLTVELLQSLRKSYLTGLSRLGTEVVRLELVGHESRNEVAEMVWQQIQRG